MYIIVCLKCNVPVRNTDWKMKISITPIEFLFGVIWCNGVIWHFNSFRVVVYPSSVCNNAKFVAASQSWWLIETELLVAPVFASVISKWLILPRPKCAVWFSFLPTLMVPPVAKMFPFTMCSFSVGLLVPIPTVCRFVKSLDSNVDADEEYGTPLIMCLLL